MAQLPGSFFATTENAAHYYGVTQKNAYRRTFDDARFTFYVDSEYRQIQFLEAWMDYISSSNPLGQLENGAAKNETLYDFNYPDENYIHSIYLTKFNKDVDRNDVITYTFSSRLFLPIYHRWKFLMEQRPCYNALVLLYDRYVVDKLGKSSTTLDETSSGGLGSFGDPNSILSRAVETISPN